MLDRFLEILPPPFGRKKKGKSGESNIPFVVQPTRNGPFRYVSGTPGGFTGDNRSHLAAQSMGTGGAKPPIRGGEFGADNPWWPDPIWTWPRPPKLDPWPTEPKILQGSRETPKKRGA